jgi:hypothetical protein
MGIGSTGGMPQGWMSQNPGGTSQSPGRASVDPTGNLRGQLEARRLGGPAPLFVIAVALIDLLLGMAPSVDC